jgi:hypothetical protein
MTCVSQADTSDEIAVLSIEFSRCCVPPFRPGEGIIRAVRRGHQGTDESVWAQYKWQATVYCMETSLSTGSSRAQWGMAKGQRVWKRQPEGGLRALGTSPVRTISSLASSGCKGREAAKRALV